MALGNRWGTVLAAKVDWSATGFCWLGARATAKSDANGCPHVPLNRIPQGTLHVSQRLFHGMHWVFIEGRVWGGLKGGDLGTPLFRDADDS